MIAAVTEWVKSIIFVVLFASFLEMLLPNNSMQRFVRVIMGLFIMLAILNPVIGVIENRATADQLPALASRSGNDTLSDSDIVSAINNVSDKREQLARELYQRDLSKQIRATVLAVDGVADAKVVVDMGEDKVSSSKAPGKIRSVVVYIEPGITADERKISQVIIGPKAATPEQQTRTLSVVVRDKVKRTVTELYQLRSDQVEVKQIN